MPFKVRHVSCLINMDSCVPVCVNISALHSASCSASTSSYIALFLSKHSRDTQNEIDGAKKMEFMLVPQRQETYDKEEMPNSRF